MVDVGIEVVIRQHARIAELERHLTEQRLALAEAQVYYRLANERIIQILDEKIKLNERIEALTATLRRSNEVDKD